jgi:hypothetical protein
LLSIETKRGERNRSPLLFVQKQIPCSLPSPSPLRVFWEDVSYFVDVTMGQCLQNIHIKGVAPKILAFNNLQLIKRGKPRRFSGAFFL